MQKAGHGPSETVSRDAQAAKHCTARRPDINAVPSTFAAPNRLRPGGLTKHLGCVGIVPIHIEGCDA